ncbi:MAG: dienelactone hydrolase [Acidobacteriota bacterium]|nr:dienelactone hydrolase [Acidobacteriota bacterium]
MNKTESWLCVTCARVRDVKTLVLLTVMLLVGTRMFAEQNAVTPSVDIHGPHAVGLKVVYQYDYSRNFRFSTDVLGQPFLGERARPIQTLVWYPAQKADAKPMTVADYLHLVTSDARYEKLDAEKEEASLQKSMASTLADPMWAVRDAPLEAGRYPVIIYGPGMDDDAWENASLCEYLASYGYVVIASPSTAVQGRYMDGGVLPVNMLARDITFLLDYAQTLPNADPSQTVVAGYSYGGLAGLFAAARDSRIKALVGIDGTLRYAPEVVKHAGDVHPEQMSIPLIFFGGHQRPDPAGDLQGEQGTENALYAWKHGDVTVAWMLQMKHGNFPSLEHHDAPAAGDVHSHEEEIILSRAWIERYTLEFLDAHLKQDPAGLAFLKKTSEENGVPASVMRLTSRAAQGAAPTLDGFRAELGRRGFEQAPEVYTEMHAEYPAFKLEESRLLNSWVYALIERAPAAALGLLKAYELACPNSREVYYLFGQAYEKAGQKPQAMDSYKRAIKIEPDFHPAQQKLMALEGNTASAQ